jgi:hypothetical protein
MLGPVTATYCMHSGKLEKLSIERILLTIFNQSVKLHLVYLFYVDIGALQDGLIIIIIMVFVVQL